jgi:hypothetical protein
MLGLLWAHMQHHMCKVCGVSETTYGSIIEKLLYGIGQGSCAPPIHWSPINLLILAALEEKVDCIRLVTIDGVKEHIRPGDSSVDDTTEPVSSEVQEFVE